MLCLDLHTTNHMGHLIITPAVSAALGCLFSAQDNLYGMLLCSYCHRLQIRHLVQWESYKVWPASWCLGFWFFSHELVMWFGHCWRFTILSIIILLWFISVCCLNCLLLLIPIYSIVLAFDVDLLYRWCWSHCSTGALAFDAEYSRWLEEQNRHISELRAAVNSHAGDTELHTIVDNVVAHFNEVYRLKGTAAKADVFHILSGMWKTPAERCFMWIGGFRSSELLKVFFALP